MSDRAAQPPGSSRAPKRATFESLRIPAYRVLWWSSLFSFLGVQMQFLLRGLLAWDLTEREGALGVVFFVFGLSLLVATLLGGVAADRLPNRALLLTGQITLMLSALGMGVVVIAGVEQFWMLLVASVAQGVTFGLIGPARVSMTAELVGGELLGNAVTLSTLSMSATRIFGPAVAGVLAGVALFGIGGAYLVAAGASMIAVVVTTFLPDIPPAASGSTPLADIVDGVRFVAERAPLRRMVLTTGVVIMFGFNYVVFMTPLVEDTFGRSESWVGWMSTASSIGAVAVAMPLASRADSPRARSMILMFGLSFGLWVAAIGVSPNYWVACAVVVMVGGSTTGFQSLTAAVALGLSDTEHRGRVQSLMQLPFAGFAMAALPLGLLAERVGLDNTFVVMGAAVAIAMVLYGFGEGLLGAALLPEWLRRSQPSSA